MVINKICLLFLMILNVCKVIDSEKPFKSLPSTVKANENDTAVLPCYIEGMEKDDQHKVRWYKDTQLIGDSSDAQLLLQPRVEVMKDFSLKIEGLRATDTADYTCEIVRGDKNPLRQVHSIEVQYAPTVKTIPEDGYQEVDKGDFVDIRCEADGTPRPFVNWKKNGESIELLQHRSRLRFKAEHRHLAGAYECAAHNGVGDPVRGIIRVVIHDAPEVQAVSSFVHSAPGLRASLAARVSAGSPAPRLHWYREGHAVKPSDRIHMIVEGDVHQLIIRSVRASDFGNYTFRAENRLGMHDVSFKLTGVPNVAYFKVDPTKNNSTSTSYVLIWEVDSYSSIIEYNLWLRPYVGQHHIDAGGLTTENPNQWSKIVVPGDSSEGPIHSVQYVVRGLTPSRVYEATVASRNSFGWSQLSSVLRFDTQPPAYRIKAVTVDYSDLYTPTLEEIIEESNLTRSPEPNHLKDAGAREHAAAILICIVIVKSLLFC